MTHPYERGRTPMGGEDFGEPHWALFYSQRLTRKNTLSRSTTTASTRTSANSTNDMVFASLSPATLAGADRMWDDEPEARSAKPVDSLRRGDSGPDRAARMVCRT